MLRPERNSDDFWIDPESVGPPTHGSLDHNTGSYGTLYQWFSNWGLVDVQAEAYVRTGKAWISSLHGLLIIGPRTASASRGPLGCSQRFLHCNLFVDISTMTKSSVSSVYVLSICREI